MDDVALVRELQRTAGLLHDAQRARKRKCLAVIQQRLQTLSFDQLHGDIVQAVFFARVKNHHDIRMGEQASGARFGLEAREKLRA